MGIEKNELNIKLGTLPRGPKNLLTDVKGVKVGHCTLNKNNVKTGVTAIFPHDGNIFLNKVTASCHVINGFGKSTGLIQIEELGNIETPIILTNTLSIGTGINGLIKYMLKENEDIGTKTGTVNPIVCECNDGYLNDIRGMQITEEHIYYALENASDMFEEGSVGAGTGMSCFELKGGIGSSSRILNFDGENYTLGSLVLSNFGSLKDFAYNNENVNLNSNHEDSGSIIMVIGTDIPLNERQLKRVCKRASISLGRLGSHLGNGSGDIVIGFSNSNIINHYEENDIIQRKILNENKIDLVFKAAIESIEESIISSMIHSKSMVGMDGHFRMSLLEYLGKGDQ